MLLGLRVGDPHDELLGAWLAKENVRDIYLTDDRADAEVLIDKAIVGCADDEVPEIRSLGKTLASWRTEILAHHDTGASNGPTEASILWSAKRRVFDVADGDASVCGGRVIGSVSSRSPMSRAA